MDWYYTLKEGIRFFKHTIKRKFFPYRKYKGNHEEICEQIIEECWNGKFFKTGAGNFNQFWSRDFGMCVESLINLGHKKRVKKTIEYALNIFSKYGKITTQITPDGVPIDFPCYTPESISYMVRNLRLLNDRELILKYEHFINKEVNKVYKVAFDKKLGIIKKDKHFSTMKDHYIRNSSMYNNSMLFMLSRELDNIKLNNPFKKYDFKKIQKDLFWNGEYFCDDLGDDKYIAGDANVFAFWSGNFSSKKMFKSVIELIKKEKLDSPWPLKYTKVRHKNKEMGLVEFFAHNYEGNTLWMHLGLCFVKTVSMFDKKMSKKYLLKYKQVIEKHKNFLEVFNPNGTIYKSFFYTADESMLWCSIYLDLVKNE